MPGTRKLGRATDSRKAMLRAMVTYLFENGKIETTVPRAKEVRSMAEKMITLSKAGDLPDKRQIFSYITKEHVAKKVIDVHGPKDAARKRGHPPITRNRGAPGAPRPGRPERPAPPRRESPGAPWPRRSCQDCQRALWPAKAGSRRRPPS